jgi:conjugative relaxase-like TrwC/TraI family protein
MLSLANVGNGAAAASYYEEADDYYHRDQSPSAWWGEGAESLKLSGPVEAATFAALLDGKLPTGEMLHHAAAGRRGGTDATFSAPKSVSLQALVAGDLRVIEAHRVAVDRALAYAQKSAACRVTEGGITRSERTGNLLVARFDHDLSRACDPQLHTHCVMVNATRRLDGQWRAMDNEPIYRMKMLLGALYRAELAHELQALGYEVRVTHLDGRFELAHIEDHQVRAFSHRSAAIEQYLKVRGKERHEASAWEKRLAAVQTREQKTQVDRAMLRREWQALSREYGIDYGKKVAMREHQPEGARIAVREAIDHVAEREAAFGETALKRAGVERAVGVATFAQVEAAVEEHVQAGVLVRNGERYTTPGAQQQEREILAMETAGRGAVAAIHMGDRAALDKRLTGFTAGQRDAVLGMLLTHDQVTGIQGRAGVGKTTLLRRAAEMATANGYSVKGLAPSASAARELASCGIASESLSAFDARKAQGLNARTLVIVDEAGMVSTRQMHAVLSAAREAGARVVLVGDTAQLQAVEAGRPFAQLQAAGMAHTVVGEIQRQKDAKLKRAVELAVEGRVMMAVQVLDKHIVQIEKPEERFARIAADYTALLPEEREHTRVIAGTRLARGEINRLIREAQGFDDSKGVGCVLLERKDLTHAQARSTLGYDVGDVLIAEVDYPSLGMKRGDRALVAERARHRLLIERSDGERVAWRPALVTRLTAHVATERAIAAGELVRVTANDHRLGLVNGDRLRVAEVDTERQVLTVEREDGEKLTLDASKPLPLDYGYCATVYASQGQTCERVLIEADSHSMTANASTFYVAISRARSAVQLYTDDRQMLPLAMSREVEKTMALDVPTRPVMELAR